MNLQRLRYFVTVARTGNFGRAALELNISQPALSRQIQILEAEVGSMLFSRENKAIELTSSGQLLLSRSAAILDDVDQLRIDIGALDRLAVEHVVIGAIQSVIDGWIAEAIAEARSEFPRSTVMLRELTSPEIIDRVRRGYLDIGIVGAAPSGPGIKIAARFKEGYLAVFRADHRLAAAKSVNLVELSRESFVQFRRGYRIRDTIDAALEEAGVPFEVSCEVDSISAIQTFLSTGRHVTLLPEFTANRFRKTGELVALPVEDLELSRHIFVILNGTKPLGPLFRSFLERINVNGARFGGAPPLSPAP